MALHSCTMVGSSKKQVCGETWHLSVLIQCNESVINAHLTLDSQMQWLIQTWKSVNFNNNLWKRRKTLEMGRPQTAPQGRGMVGIQKNRVCGESSGNKVIN